MKRLKYKDCKKVYFAYKLGIDTDGQIQYSAVQSGYAQVSEIGGTSRLEEYGTVFDYDTTILFQSNKTTKFIDKFTKIWIDVLPIDENSESDYEIVQRGRELDGIFKIYLNHKTVNFAEIWYEVGDSIYSTGVSINYENSTISIPYTKYLPIDDESLIWTRKPTDDTTTDNLIRMIDQELVNETYIINFEEVAE